MPLVETVNLKKIFKSPGKNSQDKAVAEVIGTILIFAIVISLLTTFVMWYVPNVSTSNEQNYQAASETSMISIASSLSSTNFVSGSTVSFPVSIGIKGVSPFSGPSDTSLNFVGNGFTSLMNVSFNVNYTNSTGIKHNYSINIIDYSSGTLFSSGNTQFINPVDFVIEDGYLLADYGLVQPSFGYGPLPFDAVNNSGSVSLSVNSINMTGPTISTAGYGSTILELNSENASVLQYSKGGISAVNGSISYVNSIYLSSFNYTITTPFISAWNFSMYTQYNSSIQYSPVKNNTSWYFGSVPFETSIYSGKISVFSLHAMEIDSINIHYAKLGVVSV
jgi:flagellin-like protein